MSRRSLACSAIVYVVECVESRSIKGPYGVMVGGLWMLSVCRLLQERKESRGLAFAFKEGAIS